MKSKTFLYTPLFFAGCAGVAYAVFAGTTWLRYGKMRGPDCAGHDALLEEFMPVYDVAERHHVQVAAPAALTLASASCRPPILISDAGFIAPPMSKSRSD